MSKQTRFYFAYGSNLNTAHLDEFLREHELSRACLKKYSSAYLPDRELAFTRYSHKWCGGVLDVRPRVGASAPGVVFEIVDCVDDVRDVLDAKEGHPGCYKHFESMAILPDGNQLAVFSYEVVTREDHVAPSSAYLEIVRAGYRARDLDLSGLEAAAADRVGGCDLAGLFVYGTLMRGESRHSLAAPEEIESVVLAETRGELWDLGSYPGLSLCEAGTNTRAPSFVRGEFFKYHVGACPFRELDEIEGFDGFRPADFARSLYRRTILDVGVGDGRVRRAWSYLAGPSSLSGAERIPSGDWRAHRGARGLSPASNNFLKNIR